MREFVNQIAKHIKKQERGCCTARRAGRVEPWWLALRAAHPAVVEPIFTAIGAIADRFLTLAGGGCGGAAGAARAAATTATITTPATTSGRRGPGIDVGPASPISSATPASEVRCYAVIDRYRDLLSRINR